MAKQVINTGTAANSKNGDPLRTAFTKVNANFDELYTAMNADVQIPTQTGNGGKFLTTSGTVLSWSDPSLQSKAVRNVGSVAAAGTVTLDYSTDRLVQATAAGSTLTIAHSNIAVGKVVDLVISNTSGSTCTVTYGVTTGNTINSSTTYLIGNNTTHVFTCRSFGTTTTDVYVTVV
jgi:hypothetical protein